MAKSKEKVEYGIKDTQEALSLIFALGKAVKAASKDGFGADDLTRLIPVIKYVSPAVDGMGNIPKEIKDLSKEEIKTLMVFGANHLGEFAGDNEKLVEQIDKGLSAALAILEFVKVL